MANGFANPYGAGFSATPQFLAPQQQQQQQQQPGLSLQEGLDLYKQFQGSGGLFGGGSQAAAGGGLGAAGAGSIALPAGGAAGAGGGLGAGALPGLGSIAAPAGGAGVGAGGLGSSALGGASLGGGGASGGASAASGLASAGPVGWIAAAALAQNIAHNKGISSWQAGLKGQGGVNIGEHFLDQWGVSEESTGGKAVRGIAGVLGWGEGGGIFNPGYLNKKLFGSAD